MVNIGKNTDEAKKLLQNGGLVAIPTETVYGLAANALDSEAVLKIFEVKQRPFFDPLIIHVGTIEQVEKYAALHDDRLRILAKAFWPGPLTLLLVKKEIIPDIVTSGLKQVAIRIPDHPLTIELLQKIDFPLAAPSANPFGYISPTEAEHVSKQLGDKIDYILDGGRCTVGIESTIVGVEDDQVCVYRLGGLAIEEIEKRIGKVQLRINLSSDPKAPGQLKSHYAPAKPLYIAEIKQMSLANPSKNIAAIVFGNKKESIDKVVYFDLSQKGDLKVAAINLFSVLRKIDEGNFDLIVAELLPDEGIGRAINDRLKRAETKI